MTCSKYQFLIFRAPAYLLIIIDYLIIIGLRKEIGIDQYMSCHLRCTLFDMYM